MGYMIVHALVAIPSIQFVPTAIVTRGNQTKFIQIQARTNYYKYTFFSAIIPLCTQLPQETAGVETLDQFKQGLATIQLHTKHR